MAIEDEQTEDLNNKSSDLLGREGFTARTLATSTAHKRRARPFQSDANLFEQHLGTKNEINAMALADGFWQCQTSYGQKLVTA